MKIGPVDSGDRPSRPEDEEKRRSDVNSDQQRQMNQTDKVEISSIARTLSEKTSPISDEIDGTSAADQTEDINDIRDLENRRDKIELARQRIESGYYESAEVKEDLARRITDDFIG
jgi:hypothetical protein